ncbi:MAG: hypothetical protein ACLRPW_02650 [Intestinibacter sp.]
MLQCLVKEKLQNTWTNYLQLRIIGACNTIINKDGKLIGDITDGKVM